MDGAVGTSSASTSASDCWMARASAAVFGLEGIQRAVAPGLFDDAAHHRVDRAGLLAPQGFDRREPLGHPRPLVQQRGQLGIGREINGPQLGAGGSHLKQRRVEGGLGLGVAVELQLVRHRETRPRRPGTGRAGRHAQ